MTKTLTVGAGLYPLTIMRLEVLRGYNRPSVRDDYGRASGKCSVWMGNHVMPTTRPATSKAHDYNVRGQRHRALWITVPPCASGYQLKKNADKPRNAA
eukprot:6214644-Pleurochrysis_carterae.AAC.2